MPDPAILALIHHLNWTPPAIVQSVVAGLQGERIRAYASFVAARERELSEWIENGKELRAGLWQGLSDRETWSSASVLSELISTFEAGLRREAKIITRLKKEARKIDRDLSAWEWAEVSGYQDRLTGVAERFYVEGQDFASFLRAVRAELNSESRGGPTFDDPQALERFLLSGVSQA